MKNDSRTVSRRAQANGRTFDYSLALAPTERLSISVYPDLRLSVIAPLHADPEEVDRRVARRAAWIVNQWREFKRYHPLPQARKYVSGETHLYLGRQYRLRVRKGRSDMVELHPPFIYVRRKGSRFKRSIESALAQWYAGRAREVFADRYRRILKRAPWLAVSQAPIRVRAMSSWWGSCGPSGTITLNVDLVKAPISAIDYVIAHELCHRVELRHSRRFYDLMRRTVPDWERARERLNLVVR